MLGKIIKGTKKVADTVAEASPQRMELGKRGLARTRSKEVQKSYDRLAGEVKWLEANNGSAEDIARRKQSMKDMFVTHLINKKPADEVTPRRPVGAKTADELKKEKRLKQIKEVAEKRKADKAKADNNKPEGKAKGGIAKKKAIGATDYRMNKGGLLLSSVDNRKKK